jgi:hypothetical protein
MSSLKRNRKGEYLVELNYQAETTIQTQKVVQLLPNGKIQNLPLMSPTVQPTLVGGIDIRVSAGHSHSGVKLDDRHYLFSLFDYGTTGTNRFIWLMLAEKQPDGSFVNKVAINTNLVSYGANGTKLFKIDEKRAILMYSDQATGGIGTVVVVTVYDTYDGISVGEKTGLGTQTSVNCGFMSDIVLMKSTPTKDIYACVFSNDVHFFSRDKASDTLTFLNKHTHLSQQTYAMRSAVLRRVSDTRVVHVYFYQNISTADNPHFLQATAIDVVYDANDNISTAPTGSGFSPTKQVMISAANYSITHRGMRIMGDEIFWDFDLSATNVLYHCEGKAVLDGENKKLVLIFDDRRSLDSGKYTGRYSVWYDFKNHVKYHFVSVTGGGSDVYASSLDYVGHVNAPEDRKLFHIDYPYGAFTAMGTTDVEGECFALSSDQSNRKAAISLVPLSPVRPIPIGVARSQTTVTLNGACTGFNGLKPGQKYYYDEAGNISEDVRGTYLGTAMSPTTLFIDKMLF